MLNAKKANYQKVVRRGRGVLMKEAHKTGTILKKMAVKKR